MFQKLKYKYGLHRLRKDFRKPENNAVVCNLNDAKSVGIIYNAAQEKDFNLIKDFVGSIKKNVPQVMTLGFVDDKQLANFHIQPLDFSFFCQKDLNWYFKPTEAGVQEFVKKQFDILIDLNLTEILAVRFVLAESAALFKTGRYCSIEPNYYDLMISLPNNDNDIDNDNDSDNEEEPLLTLIKQTEYYLKMIKTK